MSNHVRVSLIVVLMCIIASFSTHPNAGEFGGQRPNVEPTVLEVQDMPEDSGFETVYKEELNPNEPQFSKSIRAGELLNKWILSENNRDKNTDNDYMLGWNNRTNQYLRIEYVFFKTNPKTDKDFFLKRDVYSRRAILSAKMTYLRFIGTEMSAKEQMMVPGTNVNKQLTQETRELQERAKSIAEKLGVFEEIKTEALEGVTLIDRIDAILDAVAQYFSVNFDPNKKAIQRDERYNAVKEEHIKLEEEYKSLVKRMNAIRDEAINDFENELKRAGALTVQGATVLQQAESFINGQYEIAVLLCWSPRLEQAAIASLGGESRRNANSVGTLSISDWIKTRDFSGMIGPRQFLDDQGRFNFIGISSRPVMLDGYMDERSRDAADLSAEQMTAFSIFSNLNLNETFSQALQLHKMEGLDQDTTVITPNAAETVDRIISQSFESKDIRGIHQIWGTRMWHPLAEREMHVRVFLMSAEDAATAAGLHQSHKDAEIATINGQARLREQADAARRRVEEARNVARSSTSERKGAVRAIARQAPSPSGASKSENSSSSREGTLMDRGLVENNW